VRIPPTGSGRPHFDLPADLHGHAVDYACDQDRAWFAAHPSAVGYTRLPFAHEFCCPVCVADGRGCRSLAGRVIAVRVQAIGPGVRACSPIVAGGGGCGHGVGPPPAPVWLAVGLDGKGRQRSPIPGGRARSGGQPGPQRGQP
jgi:hypothetical protein